jgi:hypothetical protein
MRNWIKVVTINLVVFSFLLVIAEIGLRFATYALSCWSSECDTSKIASLKVRNLQPDFIGLSRFDPLLGYVPREGFARTINDSIEGWAKATVTITNEGFRSNGNAARPTASILAVGDSFTFGDQVSDGETWSACLETRLDQGVDNGGVFGYGAAQSLRRAILKLEDKTYTTLILSILVGHDFKRDRLTYFSGHPRPAVIQSLHGIDWAAVPNPNIAGGEFHDTALKRNLAYFYERFLLIAMISDGALNWDWLTIEHPEAASKDNIIQWTLMKFADIKINNKILLLQYIGKPNKNSLVERDVILDEASRLNISVVDTLDIFGSYNPSEIWQGHHTPLGNRIVCDYLLKQGFKVE